MSEDRDKALAIQLDDGRVVVATPKPEDQERLRRIDQDIVLLTVSGDFDTYGHAYGDEIELDVEGHAITLRLPTPGDAEAVRKALALGAVTATIVAAGAIAALNNQAPAAPQPMAPAQAPAVRAVPAPQPRPEFRERRENAIDDMLNPGPVTRPIVDEPSSQRGGGR